MILGIILSIAHLILPAPRYPLSGGDGRGLLSAGGGGLQLMMNRSHLHFYVVDLTSGDFASLIITKDYFSYKNVNVDNIDQR